MLPKMKNIVCADCGHDLVCFVVQGGRIEVYPCECTQHRETQTNMEITLDPEVASYLNKAAAHLTQM